MTDSPRDYAYYLFDVGGTLITFDEGRRAEKYVERAGTIGKTISTAEARQVLERLNHELPERSKDIALSLLPVAEQRQFWLKFWAEGFRLMGVPEPNATQFSAELLDSANEREFQAVFPDTVPALEQLRARGKRLGIISNFSPNCEGLLRELGIADYFDFFVVSGIVGIEKPDPRIFELAIQQAGRDVSKLVYIGDSIYHDIAGARGVGMDAVLIDRARRHLDFTGPRLRDLREL